MGGFYMKMSNIKTSTVSKSAYNSRSKEYDETQRHTYNYSSKEDHVYHHVTLPEGCPEEWREAEKLWNANEKFETEQNTTRKGKQFIIAIPQELTQEQTEKAINEFQDYFAKMGYASQADQHEPESERSKNEVEKNRHVHVLTTARKITNGEFEQIKEKKVFANAVGEDGKTPIYDPEKPDAKTEKAYRVPIINEERRQAYEQEHGKQDWQDITRKAAGQGKEAEQAEEALKAVQEYRERKGKGKEYQWARVRTQDNPLDRKETVEAARAEWARICNSYLSEDQKIDHRSYERQGSDKVAQVHEGVGSHKEQDDRKAYNEEVRQTNAKLEQAKLSAETRLKEKGESHDDRESQTIGGDHRGADGVGGRAESGDRPKGEGEQQETSRNRQLDQRLQGAERADRAETASRGAEQTAERFRGQEQPTSQDDGREQTLESRVKGLERGFGAKDHGVGEATEERSGRTERAESGKREAEAENRGAGNTAKRSRSDLYFDTYETVAGVREQINGETETADRVGESQRGIKTEQHSFNEQVKGFGEKSSWIRRASSVDRGQRSVTQDLNERVEGLRGRLAELRERVVSTLGSKIERSIQGIKQKLHINRNVTQGQEKPKQTQPKQEQPKQTTESPMSVLQRAQQLNATAEPRERSEDMSRSGANSLLAQAQAQNQAADQNERTAEKPKNDVMEKFRQQKQETDQNRKEELEEVQQRTIHRRRHR